MRSPETAKQILSRWTDAGRKPLTPDQIEDRMATCRENIAHYKAEGGTLYAAALATERDLLDRLTTERMALMLTHAEA